MRVLIYEPQFLGHNLSHVALLAEELANLPCEVTVATSRQAIDSTEFAVQLGRVQRHFQIAVLDGFSLDKHGRRIRTSGIGGSYAVYRGLCRAIDQTQPDHVFVPYGNTIARIASLPAGLPGRLRRTNAEAETLLIGGRFMLVDKGRGSHLKRRLYYEMLARAPWTNVFHLDLAAVEALRSGNERLRRIVKLMPDPVAFPMMQSRSAARELLGIPGGGQYIVVSGLIEVRKGIEPLIGALNGLSNDCCLLLAGKCDPETRQMLHERHGDLLRSGRIIALDRYLSREEFDASIFAADVVAAVYPSHLHSSSIVVAAAAAGRPVVGAAVGWIGRTIENFGLGATCLPTQSESLVMALKKQLAAADHFRLLPHGERFLAFNSSANFGATWTKRLRQRLGIPPSSHLIDWEWVRASMARAA